MKFVCLLRGINVGGKNKVDMKKLKTVMEQNGFKNVLTYINSGNIIFESDHQHILNHQDHIHDLILKTFQVDSKTLVITKDDFIQITEHIPKHYKNDHEFKSDVLFYYQEMTEELIHSIPVRPGIDECLYLKQAMIYGVSRTHQTNSGLTKIVGTKAYYMVTIRNTNTVRKLKELLIS